MLSIPYDFGSGRRLSPFNNFRILSITLLLPLLSTGAVTNRTKGSSTSDTDVNPRPLTLTPNQGEWTSIKIGPRERMLHFNPNFENDELNGIQILDGQEDNVSGTSFDIGDNNEPFSEKVQTKTELSSKLHGRDSPVHNGRPHKMEQPSVILPPFPSAPDSKTIAHTPQLVHTPEPVQTPEIVQTPELVFTGPGIGESTSTWDKFSNAITTPNRFKSPITDVPNDVPQRMEVGGNRGVMENRKGLSTNRTSTLPFSTSDKLLPPPSSPTSSHPLQPNDFQNLKTNILMNTAATENKSQDCKETQFQQPSTPTFSQQRRQDDKVQKTNRVIQSSLLMVKNKSQGLGSGILKIPPQRHYSQLGSIPLPRPNSGFQQSSRPRPRPTGADLIEENFQPEVVKTLVGIFLASIVTFAAAWMSLGESNYGQPAEIQNRNFDPPLWPQTWNHRYTSPSHSVGFIPPFQVHQNLESYPQWNVRRRSALPWF